MLYLFATDSATTSALHKFVQLDSLARYIGRLAPECGSAGTSAGVRASSSPARVALPVKVKFSMLRLF